jgi:hypothetical protein
MFGEGILTAFRSTDEMRWFLQVALSDLSVSRPFLGVILTFRLHKAVCCGHLWPQDAQDEGIRRDSPITRFDKGI